MLTVVENISTLSPGSTCVYSARVLSGSAFDEAPRRHASRTALEESGYSYPRAIGAIARTSTRAKTLRVTGPPWTVRWYSRVWFEGLLVMQFSLEGHPSRALPDSISPVRITRHPPTGR